MRALTISIKLWTVHLQAITHPKEHRTLIVNARGSAVWYTLSVVIPVEDNISFNTSPTGSLLAVTLQSEDMVKLENMKFKSHMHAS